MKLCTATVKSFLTIGVQANALIFFEGFHSICSYLHICFWCTFWGRACYQSLRHSF